MLGGMLLIAGVLGPVIAGFVADRGHKSPAARRHPDRRRDRLGHRRAGGDLPDHGRASRPSASCCSCCLSPGSITGLITATAIAVLVPNEERGVCLGAFMILGALIGLGVSPILVTLGSQALGGESHLGLSLAIVGVVTGVISLVGFVMAMLNAPARPAAALS